MAFTPYYPGGWQSGEEGGTPITPDALNHYDDYLETTYTQTETNAVIAQSTANKTHWFNFGGSDTSQTIRAALNALGTRETAAVYMTSGMMGIVSGGKVTNRATFGTVVKSSDDEYIFSLTSTDGLYFYGFGATATNAAQFTVSNVYRVTGTAI